MNNLEDWLPQAPGQGPPLPRFLGIHWPWLEEKVAEEVVFSISLISYGEIKSWRVDYYPWTEGPDIPIYSSTFRKPEDTITFTIPPEHVLPTSRILVQLTPTVGEAHWLSPAAFTPVNGALYYIDSRTGNIRR